MYFLLIFKKRLQGSNITSIVKNAKIYLKN